MHLGTNQLDNQTDNLCLCTRILKMKFHDYFKNMWFFSRYSKHNNLSLILKGIPVFLNMGPTFGCFGVQ